jgi:hypothetical protein
MPFADLIIQNARAITLDSRHPFASQIAISGSRILYVGEDATPFRAAHTRMIDAQQHTVMPGITDTHFHLEFGSRMLLELQAHTATDLQSLRRLVQEYAAAHPDRWIVGHGLRYNIADGAPLTRQHLDEIESQRPLLLIAFDYHTIWANTIALLRAGLLNGAVTPAGSEIVMGSDGLATGELREPGAYDPLLALRPEFTPEQEREALLTGMRLAASLGITGVQNMNGTPSTLEMYAALENTGELLLRVSVPYDIKPETDLALIEREALPMAHHRSPMVRTGYIKLFMDGVIESGTALLVESYADQPGYTGTALYTADHFNRIALEADRLGLQIAVHAVGDGAVRRTLDGYERAQRTNGKRDSRHRIEHIELLHPADLPRFAALGVVASMQPIHAPAELDGSDTPWLNRVPQHDWSRAFPWQTIRASGVRLVFGSDWPVASLNPWHGIAFSLTRQPLQAGHPDQRQTLENALHAYTTDAAYVDFQEKNRGKLTAGLLADLIVLDRDLFEADPAKIAEIKPILTICHGRVTYEA